MESDCVPEIPPDLEAESAVTVRRRRKKATIKVADADLDKASKYFVREGDSAKCNIIDCNSSLCRWTAYYLKRHLQLKHFSIYAELFAGEIDVGIQSRIDAFTTMQNAVTLVTSDGYPFFLLDRPAFRALIQPGLDNLAKYGQIVTINRAEIVQQIAIVSNEVRNHIKSELQNRFVSVMLDITTKSTLSVLGVNVSFIENDVVIIRSLGVINMTERHTGENIALVVQELFSVFDLPITNIFAITTDNGANMVKCTRVINEIIGQCDAADNNYEEIETDPLDCDDDEQEVNTSTRFSEIINNMTQNLQLQNDYMAVIPEVRCCAHTLQLAIADAIRKSNASAVISKINRMCKALRNQVINIEFRKLAPHSTIPPLDVVTRWCSQYIMVFINIFSLGNPSELLYTITTHM